MEPQRSPCYNWLWCTCKDAGSLVTILSNSSRVKRLKKIQPQYQFTGRKIEEMQSTPNPTLMNEPSWCIPLIVLWRTRYRSIRLQIHYSGKARVWILCPVRPLSLQQLLTEKRKKNYKCRFTIGYAVFISIFFCFPVLCHFSHRGRAILRENRSRRTCASVIVMIFWIMHVDLLLNESSHAHTPSALGVRTVWKCTAERNWERKWT